MNIKYLFITLLTFLKKEIVKLIIICRYKYIIYKLYLHKFINSFINSLYIYTYKNQIKKNYIKK